MKSLFFIMLPLCVTVCIGTTSQADCPVREYGWTKTGNVGQSKSAYGVTVDDEGNSYVVGSFHGKIKFDPKKRKNTLKSHRGSYATDIFIASFTSEGLYRWSWSIGGHGFEAAEAVTMTPDGDIVITGRFEEAVDFNPEEAHDYHVSNGNSDVFVTLFKSDGSYRWTRTFGGISSDTGYSLAADANSNIIITGRFQDTVDFNPNEKKDQHTSNGDWDVFVTKLGWNGSYRWTRIFGGSERDDGWKVTVAPDNNILVTGEFRSTVDFIEGKGNDIHVSEGETDAFITKFDSDGSYAWTHTYGSSWYDAGQDIVTDDAGNIYITGGFWGEVDFDRRGIGDNHSSKGAYDAYVTKRGLDGSYHWTQTIGSKSSVVSLAMDLDHSGLLVIGGYFDDTIDFDFGEGVDEHTSLGEFNAFITHMTTDGRYSFTDSFGGRSYDRVRSMAIDPNSGVIACGAFRSDGVDFDPTSGKDIRDTVGGVDLFITKQFCGQCDVVELHNIESRNNKIVSRVRAIAPGGKVSVKCTGDDATVKKKSKIGNDHIAHVKFKNMPIGQYECIITQLKDVEGNILCNTKTSPRKIDIN